MCEWYYECSNCGRMMDTPDGYAYSLCDHCYNQLSEDGGLDDWLAVRAREYDDVGDDEWWG